MCGRARARAAKRTNTPTESRRREDAGERGRGGKKKNSDPAPRILPSRRVTCSQLSWLSKQVFSPLCKSTGGDGAASADGEGIGGEDSSQVEKREPKTLMLGAEGSPGPDERKVNSF